jgi:hypothetical protein
MVKAGQSPRERRHKPRHGRKRRTVKQAEDLKDRCPEVLR